MSERKFGLKVTEEELKTLILHHASSLYASENLTVETSKRIHDLMKRLHNDGPEIESDPRPKTEGENQPQNQNDW